MKSTQHFPGWRSKLGETHEFVGLSHGSRLLDEPSIEAENETALLSESSLARDWNHSEEDEAWKTFQ